MGKNQQFSGVTIIIFIALGVLVFVLLFIFAKRQIMRFALRSRRGPHVPVGHDAPRWLRKEIERRLDAVVKIKYEPKLLKEDYLPPSQSTANRMKVLDKLKDLELLLKAIDPKWVRPPGDSVRPFLTSVVSKNADMKTVQRYCDIYEQARHSPENVSQKEVEEFEMLANSVIISARVRRELQTSDPVLTKKKSSFLG